MAKSHGGAKEKSTYRQIQGSYRKAYLASCGDYPDVIVWQDAGKWRANALNSDYQESLLRETRQAAVVAIHEKWRGKGEA